LKENSEFGLSAFCRSWEFRLGFCGFCFYFWYWVIYLKYLLNDMLLPFGCLISCWLICSLCSAVVDGDVSLWFLKHIAAGLSLAFKYFSSCLAVLHLNLWQHVRTYGSDNWLGDQRNGLRNASAPSETLNMKADY